MIGGKHAPRSWLRVSAWGLGVVLGASVASAQGLTVRAEGGGGAVVSSFQRDALGYGPVAHGALRVGYGLGEAWTPQVSATSLWGPAEAGAGQAWAGSLGLRFEPRVGRLGRFYAELNGGATRTGALTRLYLDAALGLEFALGARASLGPAVRYHRIVAAAADHPGDAQFVTAGVGLSWRGRAAAPAGPPPDTDGDGVRDPDDRCPREPSGARPDLARIGCPLGDRDADGMLDPDDACPDRPAGPTPDPARAGCPFDDRDADGVADAADACPDTAQGPHPDPSRPGCPDPDGDGDGVTDHADVCPDTAQGPHPDPARTGCPAPDRDGDSVPDTVDRCPDRPGAPSTNPARNGCPGLVRIEGTVIRILRPVFFATNRDRILPASNAVLAAVADAMRADRTLARVRVEGHTDDVADDAFNLALSERRAQRVVEALVARGIEAQRLVAHGLGETRPVDPRRTRAARALNRRVEFHIVGYTAAGSPE